MTPEEFLQVYINLIDENNFEELYRLGPNVIGRCRDMGHVTEYLLKAGINPLEYLFSLPEFYLADTFIENFIVPQKITEIGEFAFFRCSKLNSITIPDSVNSIGQFAFAECSNLTIIKFPENLRILNEHICKDCTYLFNALLPSRLEVIGHSAFLNCKYLKTIKIPITVKHIQSAAFMNCPLMDIYYDGTKENWSQINKERAWIRGTFKCKIHCSDGDTFV